MIRSMTGYGRATVEGESAQVVVEITSVNRKNLDVAVSLPKEWQRLEPDIIDSVKQHVHRGRINVSILIEAPAGNETAFFNTAEVDVVLGELAALSEKHGIPFEPNVALLFEVATSNRLKAASTKAETILPGLLGALEEALGEMMEMRAKEGEALARDLAGRRAVLADGINRIREASSGVVADYRETLLKRLRQSGLDFTLEDERVLKEIAIYADRCDISEELTRLDSHLAQFEEFLGSTGPSGRKFEFLLQEIGREFNTIGSKANDSAISRIVIDCKNEIERVREQVLNAE